ncbi:MAG: DUF4435 domain-containing protein [Rikenellaceae bacterium]|nr:DUF4435 domain-containing protein [Alistipes sp.]MBR2442831.1 DUF4435 domain-containing protein [Rikenellaceae bacterium]
MTKREENKLRKREEMLEKIRAKALARGKVDLANLPTPLSVDDGKRLVRVFVEGYEDVAFWRGIFDHFSNPYLRFEISVPTRKDLPKGKKVLLSMAEQANEELLLCMDSDFDYLFDDEDEVSRQIVESPYMFHTYTYATENYLCYAPSLHNVCVKAVKNDAHIFDFERFMADYSRTIYPLFLWYAYSASRKTESVLPLVDFKAAVRIGYLDIEQNGANTIAWLQRNIERRVASLEADNPDMAREIPAFAERLRKKGVEPDLTYLFMHGHTLMDNVVLTVLSGVCEKLRQLSLSQIICSSKEGVALKNEMSNYTNTLRSIRDVLLDNENYTTSPLYKRLKSDIQRYIDATIAKMGV